MKLMCRLTLFPILPLLLFLCGQSTLTAQPDSHHPGCGTFIYMSYVDQQRGQDLAASDSSVSDMKESRLLSNLFETSRLNLEKNIVSRNGHFRIHFDVSGKNAPSPVDADGNGIPDYIDSVDYYMEDAWRKEIEECGYITPPEDNPRPGTGGIDGRIDVYILDYDGAVYGLAMPEAQLPSDRVTGYLLLDNDYDVKEQYPTPGIEGLRITCAHEFHHIVQFSSYRYEPSQAAFYEATSTWIEYKTHPDVADYRSYFNVFLGKPQWYAFSTHNTRDTITGYAHMHYLLSLSQQLGPNIVRSMWEEFRKNGRCFDAIDEALLKTGSGLNLANSYCTFAHWSYYTGKHAKDTAFFAKADLYPTIPPVQTRAMPEEEETGFIGSLMPLSFGVWRLTLPRGGSMAPDIIDFLVTNARSDIGAGGPQYLNAAETFALDVSRHPLENYLPIRYATGELFYRLSAPNPNFCVEPIINGSPGIISVASPTPQPFSNDGADRMVFAVNPGIGTTVTRVHLEIYSASMTRITELNRTALETLENLQGVVWDGRDERGEPVPSGVYIYTLSINDSEPSVGKFAVVVK